VAGARVELRRKRTLSVLWRMPMVVAAFLLATALPLAAEDSIFRDGFDADTCPAGRIEVSDLEYRDGTLTNVGSSIAWVTCRKRCDLLAFPRVGTTTRRKPR
jgi:hypothetical protein